ncbi:5-oxoprolinase subunit PxpA [Rodentibacter myodis]|uniref:5-oxoprolinase subunit A n=1 Tax=Rodentibacter myodis TaxID=1907939 RepID=A0A1V3JQD2_9PAST|nr:5-oxoprolinase subunit PxpA [Rodentibacter myodis]OOF59017.1 lactam utilization protein LamB [Rodentibacter myodis]
MRHVDLNADLAEGFPYDKALLSLLSSANIACGLHAGNAVAMQSAVKFAKENQVRIGAHPGFPDRENFGRTAMQFAPQELVAYLNYQLGALQAICRAEGVSIAYVKPHGALYNQAAKDENLAALIAKMVYRFDPSLKLMGLAGSLMLKIAEEEGVGTISEVFADRHYLEDGSLVPRTQPNAMVESDDEAIAQVLQMVKEGTVTAINGKVIPVKAESICLHGDNQHALAFAQRIVAEFKKHHITTK